MFSRLQSKNASEEIEEPISNSNSASDTISLSSLNSEQSCSPGVASKSYYCSRGQDRTECHWKESAKLTSRDRRGGDLFGATLSVDHDTGVAVIGAPGASLTGIWREVCGNLAAAIVIRRQELERLERCHIVPGSKEHRPIEHGLLLKGNDRFSFAPSTLCPHPDPYFASHCRQYATQPPTVYTTTNPHGDSENALATCVPLPMNPRSAKFLRFRGAYGSPAQAGSGATAVWRVRTIAPTSSAIVFH